MPKCPQCQEIINSLSVEKIVKQIGYIKPDKHQDLEFIITNPDEEIKVTYFCPICSTKIKCNPEDFLKKSKKTN
jgi:hypothetical protein